MPLFDSTLIRFHQAQPGSYQPYVDHLKAFLRSELLLAANRHLILLLNSAL